MLISLFILFGAIFGYKFFISIMIKHAIASQKQVVTVSTTKANSMVWQSELKAVGSLRAIRGVSVTTELAGMVKNIEFTPGTMVNANTVLVQLNMNTDIAQLRALQASEKLAAITYLRDKKQYQAQAISKQILDTDIANWKNLHAQVAGQKATIAKKIIRAPFSGRLGISAVNPGQYLNPGDKVVTLQQLDPIYVDFNLPQQNLTELKMGQEIKLQSDSFPGETFKGIITTIDPLVDVSTRNLAIEATIENPKLELMPGMFATVVIATNQPQKFITLPQTAIAFNPYGNIVYLVKQSELKKGKPALTVQQIFVTTGETRGDQITVLKGVNEGDEVVTSGQLKLKNGSEIAINNSVVPSDSATPELPNNH